MIYLATEKELIIVEILLSIEYNSIKMRKVAHRQVNPCVGKLWTNRWDCGGSIISRGTFSGFGFLAPSGLPLKRQSMAFKSPIPPSFKAGEGESPSPRPHGHSFAALMVIRFLCLRAQRKGMAICMNRYVECGCGCRYEYV